MDTGLCTEVLFEDSELSIKNLEELSSQVFAPDAIHIGHKVMDQKTISWAKSHNLKLVV